MGDLMRNDKIKSFYNKFLKTLEDDGENGNLRHQYVIKRFEEFFNKNDSILDLGCGLGLTTNFLRVQGKKAIGVDLAPELIKKAKKKYGGDFICHDILTVDLNKKFEGITLIDCMEHLPSQRIKKIFNVIKKHSKSGTKVYINIPHEKYQIFINKKRKDLLQVIDEAIPTNEIISNMNKIGFELKYFNTYGLWEVSDFNYAEFLFIKTDKDYLNGLFKCLEKKKN